MKKLLYCILSLLNIIAFIAMVLSAICPFVSPHTNSYIALFGLAFPYILFINIGFVIYWIFRRKKIFLLSMFALIIGGKSLNDFYQFNFSSEVKEMPYKIISFNIKAFNLVIWNTDIGQKKDIYNYLENEKADIICIQEFFNTVKLKNKKSTTDTLKNKTSIQYSHEKYSSNIRNIFYFGIATFSKYPIINKGEIIFSHTNNLCIYSDIKINNDTIRVYNTHLQSIHFNQDDYNLIDSVRNFNSPKINRAKGILSKLTNAFRIRATQIDSLKKHIENSPYKVMICGDFNDNPISYTYKKLTSNLNDAFMNSGKGIGSTHNGNIPFLRIDYILHSPEIKTSNFKIDYKTKTSDHFPISCNFDLKH